MSGGIWKLLKNVTVKKAEPTIHPSGLNPDSPMVIHHLSPDSPIFDLVIGKILGRGGGKTGPTDTDAVVRSAFDPGEMYIAVCREQHSADLAGVLPDGTWSGPVRDDYAHAVGDAGTHEHATAAFVAQYVNGFIGPVVN